MTSSHNPLGLPGGKGERSWKSLAGKGSPLPWPLLSSSHSSFLGIKAAVEIGAESQEDESDWAEMNPPDWMPHELLASNPLVQYQPVP